MMRQFVHNHPRVRFFAGHESVYPLVMLEKID